MSAGMKKRSGFTLSVIPAKAGIQVRKKKGFTLIELLVVIAIIALLLSILTPALNQVKQRAMRILAANRLKQYGIAIHHYAAANNDQMMSMQRRDRATDEILPAGGIVRRWEGVPFPCYLSTIKDYPSDLADDDDVQSDEWNAWRINPYLELIDKNYDENGTVTALVTSPTCSGEFMQTWIREINWPNPNHDFIEIAYTYWAGIGEVDEDLRSFNAVRYLTMDVPSPRRLLMSEILWITGSSGDMGYRYNNGKNGWSWNGYMIGAVGHSDQSPDPQATGRMQLFGDGRVEWKAIPLDKNLPIEEDLNSLINRTDDGMWNGRDSGWVGDQWDCSYF